VGAAPGGAVDEASVWSLAEAARRRLDQGGTVAAVGAERHALST
jgi:hypothetical protein